HRTLFYHTAHARSRRTHHHLPPHLRPLLARVAPPLCPASGPEHPRRVFIAHAARSLHLAHGSSLGVHPPRDRARAGERFVGLPLSPRRSFLRRPDGPGGYVLDVLVLVRGVPVAAGRFTEG